jgi:tetratricopeptide (TPR) repeat protein
MVVGVVAITLLAFSTGLWCYGTFDPLRVAKSAFAGADYRSALRAAQKRLERSPNDRDAALLAARCLNKLGFHDPAEEHYRRAGFVAMGLDDLQDRAYGLVLLDRPRRAAEVYEQILTSWPDNALALKRLAAVHMSLKEWGPVLSLATRLDSLPGGGVAAATLAGICQHELKHYSEAVSAAERVLELDPGLTEMPLPHGLFWNNLALDLMAIGRTSEARKYLTRALQTSQDPNLMELLGLAYSQEGAMEQAERSWQQSVQWNPSNADALLGLGRLCLNRNQGQEAVKWLERALQASPDALEPVYGLARAYRLLGKTSEADRFEQMAATIRASQPAKGGMGEAPDEKSDRHYRSGDRRGPGQ